MDVDWWCTFWAYINPPGIPRIAYYSVDIFKALAASAILAPVLTWLYGRRVTRLMTRAGERVPVAEAAVSHSTGIRLSGDRLLAWRSRMKGESARCARRHRWSIVWSTLALAAVAATINYTLQLRGGSGPGVKALYSQTMEAVAQYPAFSRVLILALLAAIPLLGWLAEALLFAGMASPIVLLGVRQARVRRWFFLVAGPAFLAVLLGPVVRGELVGNAVTGFLAILAFLVLLVAGLASRHQRTAVPMLTGALLVPLLMWDEANVFGRALSHCHDVAQLSRSAQGLLLFVALFVLVATPLAGIAGAILAFRALGRAYRRKWFSDAQLQSLSWFALITLLFGVIFLNARTRAADFVFAVVPAAVFVAVYWRLTARLEGSREPKCTLLLLRVFGDARPQERLLDGVAAYWRFIGPICLIGGPDLAKANVEPHELLAFVSRRTERGFITDRETARRTIDAMDVRPDPDTRYRVNEFFCAESIWIDAVRKLIDLADAILIDLRSFRATRKGTAIELALLAELGALDRTVALVGANTDLSAAFTATGLRPEHDAERLPLAIVRDSKRLKPRELFDQVIDHAVPQDLPSTQESGSIRRDAAARRCGS
jgi:hypothetical protein